MAVGAAATHSLSLWRRFTGLCHQPHGHGWPKRVPFPHYVGEDRLYWYGRYLHAAVLGPDPVRCLERPSVKPAFEHEEFKPSLRLDHGLDVQVKLPTGERHEESCQHGPKFIHYESIAAHRWQQGPWARRRSDDRTADTGPRQDPPSPAIAGGIHRQSCVSCCGDCQVR
ncbi:hypothetical protein MRB53_004912 [Persea americana]|uniref:Uncharacterized protein n=1 Tax=Persea americana TaxID=3435 RepID=A0ACC2MBQ3_PERAE|nr:hypothetical protein MRB53_004912 [Persea americana]